MLPVMSEPVAQPITLFAWLTRFAGYPARRLPSQAETLLLIAAAARAEENAANGPRFGLERRDGAKDAALRAHALRRSMVHYKCDNSAKV